MFTRRAPSSVLSAVRRRSFASTPEYEHIRTEIRDNVALITLHRPHALNALCNALFQELNGAAHAFDADDRIGAIVITGSAKAFAAGADIKEMAPRTFVDVYRSNMLADWGDLATVSKPVIAAVNGYALGGGCELAMLCDLIIAGDSAKFGQPEITLGTIPGGGGTQRLVRAVGKAKAMDMILTGRLIDAQQAERDGLVARVVPADQLLDKALELAKQIAGFSQPVVKMAKEAVNAAHEQSLQEGIKFESRLFWSSFATKDQKEGMAAFVEKRTPEFTNE
ncbi:unnamed protein product [Hyaloperonospora brassicae]|uniref:Probable enoyl-CoA hydratase, mitochondrial n=1 Tax=Hyaloperonospora brassicae TaxID=162125 RepID=A0AAV0TQU4_HYABA|nr:unnamed protein product [Hyaloperonospora brassicae]